MKRSVWLMGIATALAAGVLVAGVFQLAGAHSPQPPPTENTCAGLTDEQCDAAIQAASNAFWSRFEEWIKQFNDPDSTVNLRALPRLPSNSIFEPPQPSLRAALQHADLMLVATASAIRFDKPMTARVTLKIDRVLKGSTGSTLEIAMGGGPAPAGNWDEVDLVFDENAPLLLPGDRAVLFLEYEDSIQSYLVQSFSGEYLVDSAGKVHALELNPFAAEVNGLSVDQFAAVIESTLAD